MTELSAGIVGQLLLPATDPAGFRPFCIVAIILAFALVPIALTQAVAPTQEAEGARISPKRLYQQSPFGVVAASLCGVITSAFFALGPILAQRLGLDTRGVAVFDGQRHPWRVSPGLAYRLAFGPLRPTLCHHRHGAHGHRSPVHDDRPRTGRAFALDTVPLRRHSRGTIVPTYSVVMAHMNDSVGEGAINPIS
jgi:hypothetical protein